MAGKFSIEAVFKALDRFSAPARKISASVDRMTSRMTSSLKGVDSATSRVIANVNSLGSKLATIGGITGAATGFAAASVIQAGAEFEQAITSVGAVSLMTRDQIADLEKKALELGATTKFSATEVANGMELMGRAGFTNAEIIQGISGVLAAAAAEGAELAETSGHVSNVLKGMGLATTEATRVADVLTLASARTNSSISSLGESMKNLAPVARQMNIPLEQAVAAVALLQDVGLDASEAGTATATMLTMLAKPSKEAAAQMRRLGISFQDAQGNALPLAGILRQFDAAAKKSGGNMEVVAFFAELVGLRGQKAAMNLREMFSSGKLSTLASELDSAKGSAEKMAALKMDNLLGDWEQFGGAIDSVKIKIFNLEAGPMRRVVQRATEWISANQGLIATKIGSFVEGVAKNFDSIVLAVKRVIGTIAFLYAWSAAVKVATLASYAFRAAAWVASGALWILNAQNRAYAVVVGATTLANIANTAATWAKTAALGVYNGLVWVGTAAMTAFRAITSATTLATWAIQGAFWAFTAALTVRNALTTAGTAILAFFGIGQSVSTARTIALTAATWLATAATTAWNAVMMINPAVLVGVAVVALIGYLLKATGAWDAIKNAVAGFASSAMSYIQPVIDKVMAFIDTVKGAASTIAGLMGMGSGPELGTGAQMADAMGLGAGGNMTAQAPGEGAPAPQVVTPQERVARTISESTSTSRNELVVTAPPGTARLADPKGAKKAGISLQAAQSGAL